MEIKKKKSYKSEYVGFRCCKKEKNRLLLKAKLYSDGNISNFLRLAADQYEIKKEDLE